MALKVPQSQNNFSKLDKIVQGKLALKYQGRPIESILAVAESCKKGNVINFKQDYDDRQDAHEPL